MSSEFKPVYLRLLPETHAALMRECLAYAQEVGKPIALSAYIAMKLNAATMAVTVQSVKKEQQNEKGN